MGGGLIQLVAYGAQDVYLTGNPQITFFKAVYKRYTNFALERFEQYGIGTVNWGNKITFNIERKADLLGKSYIEFILEFVAKDDNNNDVKLSFDEIRKQLIQDKTKNNLSKSLGYSFIDYIDIDIGGTIVDTHTGHWLAIKNELNNSFNNQINNMLLTNGFYRAGDVSPNAIYISIPLQFWFNNNPGMYLPLVALQYHEVKINIKLNNLNNILLNNNTIDGTKLTSINIIESSLFCDYIYLDTEERRKFAQVSHEYLIEQLQILPGEFCNVSNNIVLIPLGFNHPIKEIIWTLHQKENTDVLGPLWSGEKDRIKSAKIQLNGTDRISDTRGIYFQTMQKNVHTGINMHNLLIELTGMIQKTIIPYNGTAETSFPIAALDPFLYSFSLKPEEFQPSGSCNFSRLDNAVLSFTLNQDIPNTINSGINVKLYGINYNVLRITSGMGGLAYTN